MRIGCPITEIFYENKHMKMHYYYNSSCFRNSDNVFAIFFSSD